MEVRSRPVPSLDFRGLLAGDETGGDVKRDEIEHEPVLCGPLMSQLALQAGEVILDATIGHGGHARLLAEAVGPSGRLIGLDVDAHNLKRARGRFEQAGVISGGPHIDLVRANFSEIEAVLDQFGVAKVDVILADLGVSTDQLMAPELGLSFAESGPLDMRLDNRLKTTAEDLLNSLPEQELADLIYQNSQERFSRKIARRVCQARRGARIKTSGELARIVCSALGVSAGSHRVRIHPATRTFQALRMAVNQELENLTALLEAAPRRLATGGRIAVISFHSGEDRIVKRAFLASQRQGVYQVLTKKPIRPSREEIRSNSRARSAKLRVAARAADVRDAA